MVLDTRLMRPSNFIDTGETTHGLVGMGALSNLGIGPEIFSSALTSVLQPISAWLQAKEQTKQVDKQVQLERAVFKEQQLENARTYAQQQALDLAATGGQKRQDQVLAMWAVGGAAVLVSALFIYGAAKK